MKSFLHYPVALYFILAYVISWGGIFIFQRDGFRIFRGETVLSGHLDSSAAFLFIAMILGPALAAFVLTGIIDGRTALKNLLRKILDYSANVKWYVAALLVVPFLLAIISFALSGVSPAYSPGMMLGIGITVGLITGFFEEIGWTGFALPRMLPKFGPLKAGILLGFVHAIWHLFPDWLGSINFYKELYFLHFLLWIVALICFRVFIVWIYIHTGSLSLAQLAHAGFTGAQIIFGPPNASAVESIKWYGVFASALVIITLIIVIQDRKSFQKNPRVAY